MTKFDLSIFPPELREFSLSIDRCHKALSDRRVHFANNDPLIRLEIDINLRNEFQEHWSSALQFVQEWTATTRERNSYELWVLESLLDLMNDGNSEDTYPTSTRQELEQLANKQIPIELEYFVQAAIASHLQSEKDMLHFIEHTTESERKKLFEIGARMKRLNDSKKIYAFIQNNPLQYSELSRCMYWLLGAMDNMDIAFG